MNNCRNFSRKTLFCDYCLPENEVEKTKWD